MKTNNSEKNYPRFIQNHPCGKDKFSGGSQERLSKSIADHFHRNDSLTKDEALPRIIGIEGGWGSGKSNVVKLLKNEYLNDSYYFFEYDAWGHQEDLQRRSFLELLTSKLIDDKILHGKTKIKTNGGVEEEVEWKRKLKYLLARKTETVTKNYPRINGGMVWVALILILTPISAFIANTFKSENSSLETTLLLILFASLPLLSGLIAWLIAYIRDNSYNLSYLLAVYQDKIKNDISYETISEDEPTVKEFKDWMQDISDHIKISNIKLVVVYDNMDRLPAEKVKELWSSIHTFFAESGFENVWTIIPFDQEHLACAFGDSSNTKTKELTKYFIAKTFPIVYHVSEPVITDYKEIFNTLFKEAFGEDEFKDLDTINRIYRLKNQKANVRDIIVFINELVAMRLQWIDEGITLLNTAIFILNKTEIMEDPVRQILSSDYLGVINKIVPNSNELQAQIAALTYGIAVEHARQIPLTNYIENCIKSNPNYDINKYADSNKLFDTVLEEVVVNIDDELIDKTIFNLGKLNRKNPVISKIWLGISERKIKRPISKQNFLNEYKIILLNLDENNQNKILKKLYSELVNFKDSNGKDLFNSLNEIDNFIVENGLSCTLPISECTLNEKQFIDFINVSEEKYNYYQIKTDPILLDEYLTGLLPNEQIDVRNVSLLNNDPTYTFPNLLSAIEKLVNNPTEINSSNIGTVFNLFRILTKEKPLTHKLDASKVTQLLTELESKPENINSSGYYDVLTMRLVQGKNVSLISNGEISKVAEVIEYYQNYGDLLISNSTWNIPLLNKVLAYMTTSKIGEKLSLVKVLPQFSNIKTQISVTEEQLLNRLSDWKDQAPNAITKANIQTIIPDASLYAFTSVITNDLTTFINKTAFEALSDISVDDLYSQRSKLETYYWHVAIKNLMKTEFMKELPSNLTEFGKLILTDIAKGTQTLPLSKYYEEIIGKIDKRRTRTTVKEIRDIYCNNNALISAEQFLYLESWFREQGSLSSRSGEVVDKILKPVINHNECRLKLIENEDFYVTLINGAGDDSFDFKEKLKDLIKDSSDTSLQNFAHKISIEIENEEEVV